MHLLFSRKGGGPGWSALRRDVGAPRCSSADKSQVWDQFTAACDRAAVPFFFLLSDKDVIQLVGTCNIIGWVDTGFSAVDVIHPWQQ